MAAPSLRQQAGAKQVSRSTADGRPGAEWEWTRKKRHFSHMPGYGIQPYQYGMMNPYAANFYHMGLPMHPWGMVVDPTMQMMLSGMGPVMGVRRTSYFGAGKGKGKGKGSHYPTGREHSARKEEDPAPPNDPDVLDPNMCEDLKALRLGTRSRFTLDEVLHNVVEFARDPVGCEELGSLIDSAGAEQKAKVFACLVHDARTLANDPVGCQVVQKLFGVCDHEQRKALVNELSGNFLALTKDPSGCRVVQTAIETMSKNQLKALADELQEHVSDCIYSKHGNHVVQKCIEQMPPDEVQFIVQAVERDIEDLVVHKYGCRVVQRLLEHCSLHQLGGMLDRICAGASVFAEDPFGNYVVQHTLQHGRKEDKKRIIAIVKNGILDYSIQKCSSNVVDKCLEVATIGEHAAALEEERAKLVRKVIGEEGDRQGPLLAMMTDRFGCHIVMRMLEHTKGPERDELSRRIYAQERRLKCSSSGRRLLAALGGS